jgi:hypothetical protein
VLRCSGLGEFNSLIDSPETLPWDPGCLEWRTFSQAVSWKAPHGSTSCFKLHGHLEEVTQQPQLATDVQLQQLRLLKALSQHTACTRLFAIIGLCQLYRWPCSQGQRGSASPCGPAENSWLVSAQPFNCVRHCHDWCQGLRHDWCQQTFTCMVGLPRSVLTSLSQPLSCHICRLFSSPSCTVPRHCNIRPYRDFSWVAVFAYFWFHH